MADIRFCIDDIDRIVDEVGRGPEAVIPVLQAIQARYRYLPQAALERVCAITDITPATIEGVTTFFAQFRRRPVGKHTISVCDGTACHVKGAPALMTAVENEYGVEANATTEDGQLTLEIVYCIGSCALAPVTVVDGRVSGRVREEALLRQLERQLGA